MKVDFKIITDGKIELENGLKLDRSILSLYDFDQLANGTGWVDLPEGILNGEIEFKGFTEKELPKMDAKGNMQVTIPGPQLHTDDSRQLKLRWEGNRLINGEGLTQQEIDDYNKRYSTGNVNYPPDPPTAVPTYTLQGNGFYNQSDAFQEQYISSYIDTVLSSWTEPMLSKFFDKVRAELLKRNEGQYRMMWGHQTNPEDVMSWLGFKRRSDDRWYHSLLGIDSLENWLKFNPQTDNVSQVATMLFKSGFVKGQFKIRMDIKAALDIR